MQMYELKRRGVNDSIVPDRRLANRHEGAAPPKKFLRTLENLLFIVCPSSGQSKCWWLQELWPPQDLRASKT